LAASTVRNLADHGGDAADRQRDANPSRRLLSLDVAVGASTGGFCLGTQREEGDVMALFLEDTKRRMQRRIDKMLGVQKVDWPSRLRYATEFARLDQGGQSVPYVCHQAMGRRGSLVRDEPLALNPNGEQDVLGLRILPSSRHSLRAALAGGGRRP
jgi:hypothetical protein